MTTDLFERARLLCERSIDGSFSVEDAWTVAGWPQDDLPILFGSADAVRRTFHGSTVYPCSLMNVKSGGCSEDCAFCAQSAHNHAGVSTVALAAADQITRKHRESVAGDVDLCLVSSGRRLSPSEVQRVAAAVTECGGPVHASLGILDEGDLRRLREAGVVCYNHNIETSRRHFAAIVTSHSYDDRLATVRKARAAGLGVCCGGIFGMGETWQDRIDMAFEVRGLDVDVVPVNFLNAIRGTRVPRPSETPREFLKIISLMRLVHPRAIIKICGGREVNLRSLQPLMFMAGANGYIAGDYLTTSGQAVELDDGMVADLGLVKGHEHEALELRRRQ